MPVPAILSPRALEQYYLAPAGAARLSDCYALPRDTIRDASSIGTAFNRTLGRAVESQVWTVAGDGFETPESFRLLIPIPLSNNTQDARAAVNTIITAARAATSIWLPTQQQFILDVSRIGIDPFGEIYRRSVSSILEIRPQSQNILAITFAPSYPYWTDFIGGGQFVF